MVGLSPIAPKPEMISAPMPPVAELDILPSGSYISVFVPITSSDMPREMSVPSTVMPGPPRVRVLPLTTISAEASAMVSEPTMTYGVGAAPTAMVDDPTTRPLDPRDTVEPEIRIGGWPRVMVCEPKSTTEGSRTERVWPSMMGADRVTSLG